MEISGKIVLITGGSKGIGAATAELLAEKGAHVVLVARSAVELQELCAKIIQKGGKADFFDCDLSKLEEIESLATNFRAKFGDPDILINNAGLGRWLFTEETSGKEAEMMIRLPYLAAFQLTSLMLPGMLARKSGQIVNVNSPVCFVPWAGASAYGAARWALRGFSEALKIDLRGTGLSVSHVVLGEVMSNYWNANPGAKDRIPSISKLIPVISTQQAANYIFKAIRRNKQEMTRPWILWAFRRLLWLFPGFVKGLVRVTSYKRNR